MKKKVGIISMWFIPGVTIAFQLAYFIGLRDVISDASTFRSNLDGSPFEPNPREIADHFVCCVGLVHYFLFGYLYSVKKHYAEKRLNGKNGKTKRWVGLEIFCQLGILFSYLLVWVNNHILYYMDYYIGGTIRSWNAGYNSGLLYLFLCRKEIISEYARKQYGDIFTLTFIIAPVLLMLLIYGIHCVFRFIQFKRSDSFNMIWATWTVVFFLVIVLLAVWSFLVEMRVGGPTLRDIADHFVCCVRLVHYFLFGYLYSVKKHYAEKRLNGKNGETKRWVGLEIFCQLGIFFSYLLVWVDNRILCCIDGKYQYWSAGRSIPTLYEFLSGKKIISAEYEWVEQYGNIFHLTFIIAPVLLMLLIYNIHCVFRFIQFKRNDCFNMIWAVWAVVFFLAIILLAVWEFRQMDFSGWWHYQHEHQYYNGCMAVSLHPAYG